MDPWVGKFPWRRAWQPTPVFGSSAGKKSACSAGDPGSIPRPGRSPGEGIGYAVKYPWASLVAQVVKNLPAMRETWVHLWVGKIPWRRECLPTPVFWPRESHGQRSLPGYSPWGPKELDTTEQFSLSKKITSSIIKLMSFFWRCSKSMGNLKKQILSNRKTFYLDLIHSKVQNLSHSSF